jgi:protein phosphatase 2C family protein 2/3
MFLGTQTTTLTEDDNFLVLACDGLYDVFTNDEIVSFVKREMESHGDCQKCCQVTLFFNFCKAL